MPPPFPVPDPPSLAASALTEVRRHLLTANWKSWVTEVLLTLNWKRGVLVSVLWSPGVPWRSAFPRSALPRRSGSLDGLRRPYTEVKGLRHTVGRPSWLILSPPQASGHLDLYIGISAL